MMEEYQNCKHCGSEDMIKSGRKFIKRYVYQEYWCHTCRRNSYVRLYGEQLRKEPPVQHIEPLLDSGHKPILWPAYNQAQIKEKILFLDILNDLCSFVPDEQTRYVGRPKAHIKDMIFCLTAKLYEGLSSRRVSSDLELAKEMGYVKSVPHFNTLLKYFNQLEVAPILETLIRLSSVPLKEIESTFAVDASGLSSAFYSRWLDVRLDHSKTKDWIKIHIICGTKSNIVTAISVTDGKGGDAPQFPVLVEKTAENFRMKEVSADKAYSSKSNIEAAIRFGAVPYIPFKANATGKARGSLAWQRMFHYFQLHREKFMERYHQRSNVESTFSMLKRKFSGKLMMKNEAAQVNEALAKLLCHNICVLIRESHEAGITADFEKSAHLFPQLHINSKIIPNEG